MNSKGEILYINMRSFLGFSWWLCWDEIPDKEKEEWEIEAETLHIELAVLNNTLTKGN